MKPYWCWLSRHTSPLNKAARITTDAPFGATSVWAVKVLNDYCLVIIVLVLCPDGIDYAFLG
jgi:hypothetical protein